MRRGPCPLNRPLTLSSPVGAHRRAGERWLTTRSVEALSVAAETLFRDRELAGFGVVVEPSGRKTYVIGLGGADGVRRVALGQHGAISTDRARGRAAGLLAGEPPAETTVAELARRYMREYVEVRCKPATVAQYRLTIDRHILPALGGAAVGWEQVAALQHGLADRPATANQAIATAGAADRAGRRLGARPAVGQSLPVGPQIPGAAARWMRWKPAAASRPTRRRRSACWRSPAAAATRS